MSTHTFFSLCGPSPVATVKVPLSQPCFVHFFRPCFRGHDEAGLLAFEALQGLPRPARGTRTKRGSRGLESIYYGGTPMRHRKTACFGALVLEPHFAQSCGRFLLLTWGKVLSAAGSESFMVEKSIAGSGARAEPLQAAAQSVATGISTVLLWLADAIRHCFLMLALLRPSRRTRQNRNRQQSAASGCQKHPSSRQARMCVFPQRGAYS